MAKQNVRTCVHLRSVVPEAYVLKAMVTSAVCIPSQKGYFHRLPMTTPVQSPTTLQCPICLECIWPCENIKTSFCHQVPYVLHWNCWWNQSDEQQDHCCVCRQCEVCRPTAFFIYKHFPSRDPDFKGDELWGEPSLRWFSPAGQGLVKSFVRGELSLEELNRVVQAAPHRPNMDNFIANFMAK